MRKPRLRMPSTKRGWRRLVRIVMLAAVLALLPGAWLQASATGRVRTPRDVPDAPVTVVFGAGLTPSGPSAYLAHRLDAAAELYRTKKTRAILVTGDNSRTDYDEPGAMRTYLEKHGVPAAKVVMDDAGFDTWDSCDRAKRIFGVDRAILVSQGFHIRRALALCAAAGIDAYGIGVDERHDATWWYGGVREIGSAGKAAFDAEFTPDPHFLGPKDPGLAKALAK